MNSIKKWKLDTLKRAVILYQKVHKSLPPKELIYRWMIYIGY